MVEEKLQDQKFDCIFVIFISKYSSIGILLERIILTHKLSQNLETSLENVSELILNGKLKHQQLAGIDPVEVVVPSTNDEIKKNMKRR